MNVENIVTNKEHLFEYYIRAVKGDKVFVEAEKTTYMRAGIFHGNYVVNGELKADVEWLTHYHNDIDSFEYVMLHKVVTMNGVHVLNKYLLNNKYDFNVDMSTMKGKKVFVESENSTSYLHEGTFHGTKLVDGILKACVEWLNHVNKFE